MSVSPFDRFASAASSFVSRAPFFAFSVLIVVIWVPSYFVMGDLNTWQLVINTVTTVLTFLLVALLQNSQERFERAVNYKLNVILEFLADDAGTGQLRKAIGSEHDISA